MLLVVNGVGPTPLHGACRHPQLPCRLAWALRLRLLVELDFTCCDGITFSGESDGHNVTYDFTRLGVRVPAFIINKWVQPNTLIHDDGTDYADNSAYTHTSFLHFVQNLWELEGLNNRVQWAKTFEYIFGDEEQDALESLPSPVWYGGSDTPEPEAFYLLNQDYSYYAELDS